ncbi:MAG: hypothetical protein ACM3ZV_13310 [Bacillota bacterium]
MTWVSGGVFGDEKEEPSDDDILDLSQLGSGDDVEAPVTSGSDPSSWDPIDIDAPKD